MGLLAIGTSCLALVWVIGRSRVPAPPARIKPFIWSLSMLAGRPRADAVGAVSIGAEVPDATEIDDPGRSPVPSAPALWAHKLSLAVDPSDRRISTDSRPGSRRGACNNVRQW